jgi:Outer membrane lipoprotein-sorting protein
MMPFARLWIRWLLGGRWVGGSPLVVVITVAGLLISGRAYSEQAAPNAREIVQNVLASDPWGLTGAEVKASVTLTDKRGTRRALSFVAASKRYDPPLSMSIVRFSAPPDLAGAGFLQIQNRNGDDDRFLFLPALKRSRRISGNLRANAFMGTDFSFGDLDRRDLRDSQARVLGREKVGSADCYVLDVIPRRDDSQYAHIELWVRTDSFLTLKMKMYDRANVHTKTFDAQEIKRVSGSWFVSKSLMTDHKNAHTTLLLLESIVVNAQLPDADFTVRALEKP